MVGAAAPTPRAVAIVLLPALVLMTAFVFSYVGAFHDPTPHSVPVAVVGPASVSTSLDRLPGDPLDARPTASRQAALSQIDDRKVYGAYDAAGNRPAGTGLVILLFVILGNPASGGPFARPLLPGLWRTIGGVLPPKARASISRARHCSSTASGSPAPSSCSSAGPRWAPRSPSS